MMDLIAIILSVLLSLAFVGALWWRAREDAKDPYDDWVREVRAHTPGFEPPYVMGAAGRYVENPRWHPHQTIRHADGTETHL